MNPYIATVEWALRDSQCRCCIVSWYTFGPRLGQPHVSQDGHNYHADWCPIPAQGAQILREAHWYERQWAERIRAGEELKVSYKKLKRGERKCWLVWNEQGFFEREYCRRPRGHDDNVHEPREGEMT